MPRAKIFGDPAFGVVKHINIDGKICSHDNTVRLNVSSVSLSDLRNKWWLSNAQSLTDPFQKVKELHQYICLNYGSMNLELPEQMMAVQFIEPDDVVLELGGNIGRNSCVIATILNDESNLVVLESHPQHYLELLENRNNNEFTFRIEPSALSDVPLIQRGWNTTLKTTNSVPPGYTEINTITYSDLKAKYKKQFNVMVVDCEGALYQILKNDISVLEGIETVIIENDFLNKQHKEFVDKKFEEHGLKSVYTRKLDDSNPNIHKFLHVADCFFQVFKKSVSPISLPTNRQTTVHFE